MFYTVRIGLETINEHKLCRLVHLIITIAAGVTIEFFLK